MYIKKILGKFLLPSTLITFIILFATLLLFYKKINPFYPRISITLAVILLFLLSWSPVIEIISIPLRLQNLDTMIDGHIDTVVVLMGGIRYNKDGNHELSSVSKNRLLKAIEITKEYHAKNLIISGGCVRSKGACPITEARLAAQITHKILPETNLILEEKSYDTYTNLLHVKDIVQDKPFYLVTSFFHMKRALIIAKRLGLNPVPVPANQVIFEKGLYFLLPSGENLALADMIFHEYYALTFMYLSGLWSSQR